MTVRKGPILKYKSNENPYYIELSNTYSLLAEFSANPSQRYQPTNKVSNFKRKEVVRSQEKMNKKINKNIIKDEENVAAIINATIKLADDKCSARNKTTIHQKSQVGKAYRTSTNKNNNSYTRDGKHVQFKIKPSISTYQQHDNKPMVM